MRTSLATDASDERTYKTKHGTKAKMKIKNIGKKPKPAKPKMSPGMKRDIEHGWTALLEIDEQIFSLQNKYPQARQAVTDFLSDHRTLNSWRLDDMTKWLSDFAAAWRAASQTAETTHPVEN